MCVCAAASICLFFFFQYKFAATAKLVPLRLVFAAIKSPTTLLVRLFVMNGI